MAAKLAKNLPGGLKMPPIGIGTFQVTDDSELEDALNAALEVGYRHIDTAYFYQNEGIIGRVLHQWFSAGKLTREDVFITTKLPLPGVHEDRVEMFMKKSLENLKLDYVDLFLIHFPVGIKYNETPKPSDVMETDVSDHVAIWKKMEEQVDAGRTKTIGVSNFNSRQIEKLNSIARIKPCCLQVELNVYLQQRELVNFCHKNNIVVVAYCPLGSPGYNQFLLSVGEKARNLPDMLNDATIKSIAEKHNKSSAQVMLRYLVQRNIVPIPKSTKRHRIKENFTIFDFELDAADMKALNALEVGEGARTVDFMFVPRIGDHPEYPFPK